MPKRTRSSRSKAHTSQRGARGITGEHTNLETSTHLRVGGPMSRFRKSFPDIKIEQAPLLVSREYSQSQLDHELHQVEKIEAANSVNLASRAIILRSELLNF
jgi:hypothetical protein